MAIDIGRRKFISVLGSATVAWPIAAHARQPEQMRRVGMLFGIAADDPNAQAEYAAFLQELQRLGWAEGRNVRIAPRSHPSMVCSKSNYDH